ncbi:MAG: hypothetical protein V7750_19740 [Sneathiella sp.]
MTTKNEEQIRPANDALLGRGNLAVVDEIFTSDYVVHAGGKGNRILVNFPVFCVKMTPRSPSLNKPNP